MFIPFSDMVINRSISPADGLVEILIPDSATALTAATLPSNVGNIWFSFEKEPTDTTCIVLYPGLALECNIPFKPEKKIYLKATDVAVIEIVLGAGD
jgi:hypothetical protein